MRKAEDTLMEAKHLEEKVPPPPPPFLFPLPFSASPFLSPLPLLWSAAWVASSGAVSTPSLGPLCTKAGGGGCVRTWRWRAFKVEEASCVGGRAHRR